MPATIWICLVEGPAGEQRIRAWTPDADRAEAFRKEGLEMQEFSAVAQEAKEPVAFINRRLEDLAEANAIYGKDQRLNAPDKIARNDREISWLKDLRSMIVLASPVPSADRGGET